MRNTKYFAIRVYDADGEIARKLAKIALAEKRSMGQQVAAMIEREFDQRNASTRVQAEVISQRPQN